MNNGEVIFGNGDAVEPQLFDHIQPGALQWARGAHEQCANSTLYALSSASCRVGCLPGPGLFMSKRPYIGDAAIGPAFVHGYGQGGKAHISWTWIFCAAYPR